MAINFNKATAQNWIQGKLPPLLISFKGNRITATEEWKNERRPERLNFFRSKLYGGMPQKPAGLAFQSREALKKFY